MGSIFNVLIAAALMEAGMSHDHQVVDNDNGDHHNHYHDHADTHNCIHDSLDVPVSNAETRSRVLYSSESDRRLETTTMDMTQRAPIRFNARYEFTTENEITAKTRELMPQVFSYWSSRLSVNRVQTPLLFDRGCSATWNVPTKDCASFKQENKCGSYAHIPEDWMNELTACSTQPGVDCETREAGVGLAETDFAIIVTADEAQTCIDNPSTLGYAYPCKFDQWDRPILGYINMCPSALATASDEVVFNTVSHELAHALGFTSSTWANMRESDGVTPRTERNEEGDVEKTTATCYDGRSSLEKTPSSTTLWQGGMRGVDNSFVLSTPALAAAARDQASCPSLVGAPLENTPTTASTCFPTHFEQRVYDGELMAPAIGSSASTSRMTLSAFEDMGWYSVNYDGADKLPFGRNAGCDFVTEKCVSQTGTNSKWQDDYFCTVGGEKSCSADLRYRSYCDLVTYSGELPEQFQYFPGQPNVGGRSKLKDYCPMKNKYSNGDCRNLENAPPLASNHFGTQYGTVSVFFSLGYIFLVVAHYFNVLMKISLLLPPLVASSASSSSLPLAAVFDLFDNHLDLGWLFA